MSVYIIGDTHLSGGVDKPMDVFGGLWENYAEKLFSNWKDKVSKYDTVVIAGDFSWATSFEDAIADFRQLSSLPGNKAIIKGNHDYWWETVTKMTRILNGNGIYDIGFIYNSCLTVGGVSVCGTRGWVLPQNEEDNRMVAREAGRLDRSLSAAPPGAEKVAVMHYPPVTEFGEIPEFIEVMRKHGVKRCYYGHLHAASIKKAVVGRYFDIDFSLVSADSLDFCPLSI